MKPRNTLESELQAAIDGGQLNPLTNAQMEQAHRIWNKRNNKGYDLMLFSTSQRIGRMKLTLCYKAHRIGVGELNTFYQLCLVRAERNGQTAWAGRQTNMGVLDSFSHEGAVSIKNPKYWYAGYTNSAYPLRDAGEGNPYAVVRHYNHNTYECRDTRMETIASYGNEELLFHLMRSEKPLSDKMFAAIKVAMRHHYHIKDTWMWLDYIKMVYLNKLDYRNPHYICPADFMQAYQHLTDINDKRLEAIYEKRIARAEERNEEARKRAEEEAKRRAKEEERITKTYAQRLKRWLGLVITDGVIVIKPLQSVEEFKKEGEAMHHCVYRNGYYKKAGCLILSAKTTSGKRLATIEFDIKHKTIKQCKAACNQHPKDYDTICALINEAIGHGKKERVAT